MNTRRTVRRSADDDCCLADVLVSMSDQELERMAEADARAEVSSSAYEGIPLDGEALKAGLLESYKKLRAEWPTQHRSRQSVG